MPSADELRAMSARCVVYIQNSERLAIHAKASVDEEIRRKEAAEAQRQSDAAALEMHQEATALSREEIIDRLRTMDCEFTLDFTDQYLQSVSLERLRHIFLAASIHDHKRPANQPLPPAR